MELTTWSVQHGEAAVQLYEDLSLMTLQQRKALRPLLDVLWARAIPYSWRFPFVLYASVEDRNTLLHSPADMAAFCEELGIPFVQTPDWLTEDIGGPTFRT